MLTSGNPLHCCTLHAPVCTSLFVNTSGLFAVLSAATRQFPTLPPSRRKEQTASELEHQHQEQGQQQQGQGQDQQSMKRPPSAISITAEPGSNDSTSRSRHPGDQGDASLAIDVTDIVNGSTTGVSSAPTKGARVHWAVGPGTPTANGAGSGFEPHREVPAGSHLA